MFSPGISFCFPRGNIYVYTVELARASKGFGDPYKNISQPRTSKFFLSDVCLNFFRHPQHTPSVLGLDWGSRTHISRRLAHLPHTTHPLSSLLFLLLLVPTYRGHSLPLPHSSARHGALKRVVCACDRWGASLPMLAKLEVALSPRRWPSGWWSS
jgi:hypothetical protein